MAADFGALPDGERYGMVPAFALRDPALKPGPKALYASLCTNADKSGRLWRSFARLAKEFSVTKRQIQRWSLELEQAGLLVRLAWRGRSPLLLVIRDPVGRGWARQQAVANRLERAVASARATGTTPKSVVTVAPSATSMSPKHDLPNKPIRTKQEARQEGAGGTYRAQPRSAFGLKRLRSEKNDEIQSAVNELAAKMGGWESLVELSLEQIAELVAAQPGARFSAAEIRAALSVPAPPR